ncbi:MAG: cytochrome b/b6 domain-containing protein [Rhodobacteraceae bacterium]|nr:cytochrome b/b6 domain-containing protein [Paracoccaceae bacterium]
MTATAAPLTNSAYSYGRVAKIFHWLTALLILTALPLGLIANDWAYDSASALATKGLLFSLHKTVGIAAFGTAVARILWALTQTKPGALHPERKLETFLAELVHWLLYISLVIVPLSGWLHHAATSGFAPIWWPFGQTLPFVPKSEAVAAFFSGWHLVFTKVLGVAVLLHIAGALKHQIIDRDLTLARMLPGHVAAGPDALDHDKSPFWAALVIYAVAMGGGSYLGLAHHQEAPATETVAATPLAVPASGWAVQQGSLGISVQQFGSVVEGSFADWTASIAFDPDAAGPEMGTVSVEIAIGSLTLGSVTAEALKPEFFAAEDHPTATFTGPILRGDAAGSYVADGTLTLKGAEMPLSLPFTLQLDGGTARMEGATVIDRRDFGIGTTSYGDDKTVGFTVDVQVALTANRNE